MKLTKINLNHMFLNMTNTIKILEKNLKEYAIKNLIVKIKKHKINHLDSDYNSVIIANGKVLCLI